METTISSFQHMIDCRIFLAFLFLFTQSVTVQSADFTTSIISTTSATTLAASFVPTTSATTLAASFVPTTSATTLAASFVPTTSATTLATKKGNEAIAKSITAGDLVMNTVSASESTSIPSTKHSLGLSSSLPSKQPHVVTQVATTHGEKLSALDAATTTVSNATKEPRPKLSDTLGLNITATQKTVETQTGATTFSGTSATTTIFNATAVVQKIHLTSGVLTTSNEIISTPKSLRPRSKERPGESTVKGLITTTWIDVSESTPTPAVSHDRETLSTDPEKITATAPSSPQRKHSVVLIVAIVIFFILLLVLVVACLYCRRRRHSGSTSFSAAGWAGQAALPDDTGLDKDVEQGLSGSGERETRRATLTTFFGKRQSRVASIAMEEIDEKEKEEAQRLIDGDAGRESSVQGSGEANGKVPESTQEKIPPTQVE